MSDSDPRVHHVDHTGFFACRNGGPDILPITRDVRVPVGYSS